MHHKGSQISLPSQPVLDHERLQVYQVALEFHRLAMQLCPRRGFRHIRDQLERATLGIVLCIAEGGGRTSVKDKRRFYSMARGSATEGSALIDILMVRGIAPIQDCRQARELAIRIVQMLSRLCQPQS